MTITYTPLRRDASPTGTALRERVVAALAEARERTLLLVSALSAHDLHAQHDPLMSPIMWDLGHIAHFEELWLVRNLEGPVEFGEMPGIYNPFEHPRKARGTLPLPTLEEWVTASAEIRARVLDRLAKVDLDSDDPLLRDGYVYAMVLQHEYQHDETILQTLQLKTGGAYMPNGRTLLPVGAPLGKPSMVGFPGGPIEIGTNDRRTSYDNERPRFETTVAPFEIDAAPVTNGDFIGFMAAGGYSRQEWWSAAGWRWLQEARVSSPKYWWIEEGRWCTRSMDRVAPVDSRTPVCHVCHHEAEAYARFAGKRLPTELEWEVAASWDRAGGDPLLYPWGDAPATNVLANVDQRSYSTAQVGAYPTNVSPLGCYGMIGDVWEWTSSSFTPYPGYECFPYPEYSKVFFGDEYKVLRGGSWATRPGAIRNTFRNWDFPIRRQIFSGFRCARDA